MTKKRKNWKDNEHQIKELFDLLVALRGDREYKNSLEWKEHCRIVSLILSHKYKEEITPNMVEGITILPDHRIPQKYTKSITNRLGYAILTGYLSIEYLNKETPMSLKQKD